MHAICHEHTRVASPVPAPSGSFWWWGHVHQCHSAAVMSLPVQSRKWHHCAIVILYCCYEMRNLDCQLLSPFPSSHPNEYWWRDLGLPCGRSPTGARDLAALNCTFWGLKRATDWNGQASQPNWLSPLETEGTGRSFLMTSLHCYGFMQWNCRAPCAQLIHARLLCSFHAFKNAQM